MMERDLALAAFEARYAPLLRRALVRSVERAVVVHEAGAPPALAAAVVSSDEVAQVLAALYLEAGGWSARRQYAALLPPAKREGPTPWGERLRRFITSEGAAAVRGITETTRGIVRTVLSQAAAAGDSVAVAARKLREQVATLAVTRSVRIVRTELVSASNLGSLLGAEATGLRLEKFWIATPGPRTRPTHQAASGQAASLQNGLFRVGGYAARYPGDVLLSAGERVNCRCSLGFRVPVAGAVN